MMRFFNNGGAIMSITVEKCSIMNKKLKILLIALAALAVIVAVAVVYL